MGAPVEHGGTITMLNNGDEFVPALLDAIAHAERTINFAVYIWSEGTFSDQLLAALEKKQREGVTVRVLLDGLGSIKVPDEDFEAARGGGRESPEVQDAEVRQAHSLSPQEPSPLDRHRRRNRVYRRHGRGRHLAGTTRRIRTTGATSCSG